MAALAAAVIHPAPASPTLATPSDTVTVSEYTARDLTCHSDEAIFAANGVNNCVSISPGSLPARSAISSVAKFSASTAETIRRNRPPCNSLCFSARCGTLSCIACLSNEDVMLQPSGNSPILAIIVDDTTASPAQRVLRSILSKALFSSLPSTVAIKAPG